VEQGLSIVSIVLEKPWRCLLAKNSDKKQDQRVRVRPASESERNPAGGK